MKAYTTEQMVSILKVYEANAFNLNKTYKDTGVSRQTIRKWANSMGFQVFSHNNVQDIVCKVNQTLADKKAIFDIEIMDAMLLIIRRIVKRIPRTKDLDSLTRGLKILNELDRKVTALDIKDSSDPGTINYIQILMKQLDIKPYEPETL